MIKLIFCSDPLQLKQPDFVYLPEVEAAVSQGFDYALLDFEALLTENDAAKAVRKIPLQHSTQLGLYRGWMLSPDKYQQLYAALISKGIYLINDPDAYSYCHYLPNFYNLIQDITPHSVWLKTGGNNISFDQIMDLLKPFGIKPLILKDFVKSRKHEWYEACYIPSASSRMDVERVVRKFIQLQGSDLNDGLVFREFVEFEPIGSHPKSDMPLTKEYRLFFLDQQLLFQAKYWDVGNYDDNTITEIPMAQFLSIAKTVQSRFFTMDIAKTVDGGWLIVELGDGQVSGLPDNVDAKIFYNKLREVIT